MGLYSARCMTSDAEEARATSTDVTEEKLSQRSGENRGSSKLVTAQSASDIEDRKPAEEGHVSLEDVDPSLEQSPDFCFEMFAHVTRFFGFKVVLLGLFNGQGLQGDYEAVVRVTEGKLQVVQGHSRSSGRKLFTVPSQSAEDELECPHSVKAIDRSLLMSVCLL